MARYWGFMAALVLCLVSLLCQAESPTEVDRAALPVSVRNLPFSQVICEGDPILAQDSQYKAMRYVPKKILDELSKTRLWPDARYKGGGVSEMDMNQKKEIFTIYGYHEEEGFGCIKLTAEGLMVKAKTMEEWVGPFVELGSFSDSSENIYFKKIFGLNACYIDQDHQHWVFESEKKLVINGKLYRIQLMLDTMESPTYGTVLRINDGEVLWVFKPQGQHGWAVYRDTWLTSDRPDPDSEHLPPWRVLQPCQN